MKWNQAKCGLKRKFSMSEFNFKSSVCTSREQSERLLALGLKKETADMVHIYLNQWDGWYVRLLDVDESIHHMEIPAWSLDRLMELVPHRHGEYCDYANNFMYYYNIPLDVMEQFRGKTRYEYLIDCIEWLIKEGYFNKEYLV